MPRANLPSVYLTKDQIQNAHHNYALRLRKAQTTGVQEGEAKRGRLEDEAARPQYEYEEHAEDASGGLDGGGLTRYTVKGNSVFIHNTVQDIGNINARECEVCNEPSDDSCDFIICENQKCKIGGGHLDCLGMMEVPESQWFCPKCQTGQRCSECHTPSCGEPLVACHWCETVGHAKCLAPQVENPLMLPSEWRCMHCCCQECQSQNFETDNTCLLQCGDCGFFWHPTCVTSAPSEQGHVSITTEFRCAVCTGSEEVEQYDGNEVEKYDGNADSYDGNGESGDILSESQRHFAIDQLVSCSGLKLISNRIQAFSYYEGIFRKEPVLAFAVAENVEEGISYHNERRWERLMLLLKGVNPSLSEPALKALRPPRNLNPYLEQKMPLTIKTTILKFMQGNVTVEAAFHYRDLAEAVAELLFSPKNRACVPIHPMNAYCDANSHTGPRLERLYKLFSDAKNIQSGDVVVPLQFASDGTCTNFSNLHPVVISAFNMDRSGRVLNLKTAQSVIAMMPTCGSLMYFVNGKRTSKAAGLREAKLESSKAVIRVLLRKAVQVLMNELKVLENGVEYEAKGMKVRLFAFLHSWATDMEERRDILDLSLSKHWVCTHCYGRPRPNSNECPIPELEALISENAPRTEANNELFIKKLTNAEQLYGEKDAWRFVDRAGFNENSHCSITSKQNFIVDGAASYFLFDRLHMLDGISNRIWMMLQKVYGSSLGKVTERYGNVHFGIPTEFRFHKMEEGISDFRFVVLAFLIGEGLGKATNWTENRCITRLSNHLRMTAAFFLIVVLLKDDAPGLVHSQLIDAITIFEEEFGLLQADLADCDQNVQETAKLHELFCHVADQVADNGPSSGFSSDIMEWTHPANKEFLHRGSKRRADQAQTILKRSYYASVVADTTFIRDSSMVSSSVDGAYTAQTGFTRNVDRACLRERGRFKDVSKMTDNVIRESVTALQKHYGIFSNTNGKFDWLLSEFAKAVQLDLFDWTGTSIEGGLRCGKRGIPIKSATKYSVLTSELSNRRQHRLLAFGDASSERKHSLPTSFCCRLHDPAFELDCSFERLATGTQYGFPLAFVERGGQVYAIVVKLQHLEDQCEISIVNRVIKQCAIVLDTSILELVDVRRLRTKCQFVENSGVFFVFTCGEKAFGHLS